MATLPYPSPTPNSDGHRPGGPPFPGVQSHHDPAAQLMRDVGRRPTTRTYWGVTRTGLLGFLTFGLAPAIAWSFALRDQIAEDRRLFTRAAEWLRSRSAHSEAAGLRDAAGGLYARPFLSVLPILCCVGVILFFLTTLDGRRAKLRDVIEATYDYPLRGNLEYWSREISARRDDGTRRTAHPNPYGRSGARASDYDHRPRGEARFWGRRHAELFEPADRLFFVWAGGLTAAYLSLWMAVRAHAASVNRFSQAFDRFAAAEGLGAPPAGKPTGLATGRWLVGGAVLVYLNAAWAPAAMIAGASRKRLAVATTDLRGRVAGGISVLATARAVMTRSPGTCPRDRCGAPLAPGSRFCRRCGAAAAI